MTGGFIISTGRSGSTLLSRMLAENRHLLVLSEFIASMDNATRFQPGLVTGAAFAGTLSADVELTALTAARGRPSPEALNDKRGRFTGHTVTGRSPSLIRACYPVFTDDPEAVFEDTLEFAHRQRPRAIQHHYTALFEWLCARFGKTAWIERSGFGIRLFGALRRCFPDAKYLHLHRDGIEAALSMYHHPSFRVSVYMDAHPPTLAQAEDAILRRAPDSEDIISRHFLNPPPLAIYGQHWSQLLALAYREMTQLERNQYMELPFEHLVSATQKALDDLALFFGLPDDPGWTGRAAALVGKDLTLRADALAPKEREQLEKACLPGQILLGRANPSRFDEAIAVLHEAFVNVKRRQEHANV